MWSAVMDDVMQACQAAVENWDAALDDEPVVGDEGALYDPVLSEIAAARREVVEAEHRMRLLLAYARVRRAPPLHARRPRTLRRYVDLRRAHFLRPGRDP